MSKIIAISNQKGGTAKTTTAITLGHALAEKEKKVLLVDLDPQSSLTISFGFNVLRIEKTIYNVLIENGVETSIKDVLIKTAIKNVDLVPANLDLSSAEIELIREFNRESTLKFALRDIKDKYDFIIIDCPPTLGLLTTNALTAADEVIIPIQCDYLAMRGAGLLTQTIKKIQKKLNSNLKISGILVTMHDTRTIHSRDVLNEIKSSFGDLVFKSVIKYSVKAKEAPVSGESLLSYDSSSEIANSYRMLAEEILNHD